MHQWQSVYETTFNALYYKLFKGYHYPVGTVRIHRSSQEDGFCNYLEISRHWINICICSTEYYLGTGIVHTEPNVRVQYYEVKNLKFALQYGLGVLL